MREVTFDVADGEFCILLGPSGCGKTTLLRLVAGLEDPSSGFISLGEKRIDNLPPQKRDVAFVFQSYALYPHMNVYENMAFSLRLRRLSEKEIGARVSGAARLLEIEGALGRRPQELSGGQRQRVAVGRAIVRQPKIFLFDEPLSNLDAALRANMRVELARLHKRLRATVLYVTHDQAEALTLGEKVIVLNRGVIQQIGSPSTIYHQPANTFVARFVGSPQMNLIEGTLEDGGFLRRGDLRLDLSPVLKERRRGYSGTVLTVGIRPEDWHPTGPSDAWIQGEVELVEDLGSDRFVHLGCGGLKLVTRTEDRSPIHPGDTIYLKVKPGRVHLFHEDMRVEST